MTSGLGAACAYRPATQAVMKQEMLASTRTRNMLDAISLTLCGQIVFQTPTAIARVDRLENPQSAYVVIARSRS